jgi:hypothetical protein
MREYETVAWNVSLILLYVRCIGSLQVPSALVRGPLLSGRAQVKPRSSPGQAQVKPRSSPGQAQVGPRSSPGRTQGVPRIVPGIEAI